MSVRGRSRSTSALWLLALLAAPLAAAALGPPKGSAAASAVAAADSPVAGPSAATLAKLPGRRTSSLHLTRGRPLPDTVLAVIGDHRIVGVDAFRRGLLGMPRWHRRERICNGETGPEPAN